MEVRLDTRGRFLGLFDRRTGAPLAHSKRTLANQPLALAAHSVASSEEATASGPASPVKRAQPAKRGLAQQECGWCAQNYSVGALRAHAGTCDACERVNYCSVLCWREHLDQGHLLACSGEHVY